MLIPSKFLKIFYNALLFGMPGIMNNPYNKNVLHSPFCVKEYSTYINYRLDNYQMNRLKDYLKEKTNNLYIQDTSILEDTNKEYFLSINIYNCSSPIFEVVTKGSEGSTRCEINTYVVDENNQKGTLIMDYTSDILSLDPDNLFKKPGIINFKKDSNIMSGYAYNKNFNLVFDYDMLNNIKIHKLSSSLIKYTDKIFYNNGLYDKLYYDSSLIHNKIIECLNNNINFQFLDMDFKDIHSVFYFEKEIDFVGGMWYNLYN